MKQIDGEMQVMADQFHTRHAAVVVAPVLAWHFASAAMSKVRERDGDTSDTAIEAAMAEIALWRKSHFAVKGISEIGFEAALTDVRRITMTQRALQKIDEVNAL